MGAALSAMARSAPSRAMRVGRRAPGLLVDDVEHPEQGLAQGLLAGPAGQPFGHRIETGHRPLLVGGDHRIADAVQGDGQLLLALAHLLVGAPALGHVAGDLGVAAQLARGVAERGHHHAGPEAGAVPPDPPPLLLVAPLGGGGPQLRLRVPGGPVLGSEEQGEGLAHHLLGAVPLEALGARVPAGHPPLRVQHVDREVADALHEEAIAPIEVVLSVNQCPSSRSTKETAVSLAFAESLPSVRANTYGRDHGRIAATPP
jgi:hypothetical protein